LRANRTYDGVVFFPVLALSDCSASFQRRYIRSHRGNVAVGSVYGLIVEHVAM
jgi:hypothetical protein